MSEPREYVTVTLSTREASLVGTGLLLVARRLNDQALEGEAQGMPDEQVLDRRDSAAIAQELMQRLAKLLRAP